MKTATKMKLTLLRHSFHLNSFTSHRPKCRWSKLWARNHWCLDQWGVTKSWKPQNNNTDKCGGFIDVSGSASSNTGRIPAKHNSCPVTVSTCLSQPCHSTWTGLKDTNGAGSAYFANSAIFHWPVGATGDSTSGCWYNLIATNGEWYLWLLIPVNQAGHRCHGILTSFLHRFKL